VKIEIFKIGIIPRIMMHLLSMSGEAVCGNNWVLRQEYSSLAESSR